MGLFKFEFIISHKQKTFFFRDFLLFSFSFLHITNKHQWTFVVARIWILLWKIVAIAATNQLLAHRLNNFGCDSTWKMLLNENQVQFFVLISNVQGLFVCSVCANAVWHIRRETILCLNSCSCFYLKIRFFGFRNSPEIVGFICDVKCFAYEVLCHVS